MIILSDVEFIVYHLPLYLLLSFEGRCINPRNTPLLLARQQASSFSFLPI